MGGGRRRERPTAFVVVEAVAVAIIALGTLGWLIYCAFDNGAGEAIANAFALNRMEGMEVTLPWDGMYAGSQECDASS